MITQESFPVEPWQVRETQLDLELLAQLADSGCIAPVIGRTFAFEETPAALAHVGTGHAVGKTVIVVAPTA